jgi:hypothetical protein
MMDRVLHAVQKRSKTVGAVFTAVRQYFEIKRCLPRRKFEFLQETVLKEISFPNILQARSNFLQAAPEGNLRRKFDLRNLSNIRKCDTRITLNPVARNPDSQFGGTCPAMKTFNCYTSLPRVRGNVDSCGQGSSVSCP